MRLLLILSLLLLTLLPARAQTMQVKADPICIAAKLAEQHDSAEIASICEYYGYVLDNTAFQADTERNSDTFQTFRHADGSEIRFNVSDGTNGKKYPTIVVKSKASAREIDSTLQELKYKKQGHTYERRIIGRTIRCNPTNGLLRFTTDN